MRLVLALLAGLVGTNLTFDPAGAARYPHGRFA